MRDLQEPQQYVFPSANTKLCGYFFSSLLYRMTGRTSEAEDSFLKALATHRQTGNVMSEGMVCGYLANLYVVTKRLEQSEEMFNIALDIHRRTGNRRFEGVELGNIATLFELRGQYEQAEACFKRALSLHAEAQNNRFLGCHGCAFALFLLGRGRRQEAREAWARASSVVRSIGAASLLKAMEDEMREACAKAGVPPLDIDEGMAGRPEDRPAKS